MTMENDLPICACGSSLAGGIGTRVTVLFSRISPGATDSRHRQAPVRIRRNGKRKEPIRLTKAPARTGAARDAAIRHRAGHRFSRVLRVGRRDKRSPVTNRAPGRFYWQLDATILTESTFSFGALTFEAEDALVLELDERVDDEPPSTVPVISTL